MSSRAPTRRRDRNRWSRPRWSTARAPRWQPAPTQCAGWRVVAAAFTTDIVGDVLDRALPVPAQCPLTYCATSSRRAARFDYLTFIHSTAAQPFDVWEPVTLACPSGPNSPSPGPPGQPGIPDWPDPDRSGMAAGRAAVAMAAAHTSSPTGRPGR